MESQRQRRVRGERSHSYTLLCYGQLSISLSFACRAVSDSALSRSADSPRADSFDFTQRLQTAEHSQFGHFIFALARCSHYSAFNLGPTSAAEFDTAPASI